MLRGVEDSQCYSLWRLRRATAFAIKSSTLVVAALAVASPSAKAETLNFRGVAASLCSLGPPVDGVITLQPDARSWATTVPATITAINTAPATLTVTRPTTWSSAPANTPATTFSMTANLTGTNVATVSVTAGAASAGLSLLGTTLVSVHLSAQAPSTYQSGAHTAQATITCSVN